MPPVIVEAAENRIVFDLLQSQQLDNRLFVISSACGLL